MLSIKFPHLFLRPEIIITFLWGWELECGAGATPLSAEIWFCFSSLCQRVVLLNLLDTKVSSECLLFSQRERESRRSPVIRGVVGWCDGDG